MHRSKIGRGSTGGNGFGRLALACPRQYDLELSEQPGLRLDVDAAVGPDRDYYYGDRDNWS